MDLAGVRAKLFRRVSSPVEIMYDVSSHWLVVVLGITLGTLIMFARGTSDPPKYESAATLVLSPNEVILDPDAARRPAPARESELNFMAEQLSLLQSDSVLDKVAARIGNKNILAQEADPRGEENLGALQQGYRWVQQKLDSLSAIVEPSSVGTVEERQRQAAKKVLRKRLKVENDRRTNLVRVSIQGTYRDLLDEEITAWIQAYRDRIEEISEETYQRLFNERMNYWVKEEAETLEKLEEFKVENAGLTPDQKKWNDEKIARLKLLIDDFQRAYANDASTATAPIDRPRLVFPLSAAAPPPPPPREEDPQAEIRRRRNDLAVELSMLRGKYAPGSLRIKAVEATLNDLDRQLVRNAPAPASAPAPAPAPAADPLAQAPPEPEKPVETLEQIYTRKLKAFQEELNLAISEGGTLDEKLRQLSAKEEGHRKAAELLDQYRSLRERKIEQTELRKIVDVQVQDRPATSIEPVETALVQKVAAGSLVGVGVGMLLAFGREFFNRRIRFKKDIEDELGLRVVGVVPGS